MKKNPHKDEIGISEIILNLWDNKIKIITITIVFIISGFLYNFNSETKFLATTNIKPISTFENQKYKLYNNIAEEITAEEIKAEETVTEKNIIQFNQEDLLNLFISKVQTENFIERAIIKFQLINKDKFKNEKIYDEAVKRTAISIIDKMIPSLNNERDKKKDQRYWKFNFEVSDRKTWRNFLEYLEKQANEEIRRNLINRFNSEIDILNISARYELEDIEQKITNELNDYNITIENKLEFLKEQAEIARTLNLKYSTSLAENFQTENPIIFNIQSENSYYLKGYVMIEKEIKLINLRKNKKAFIPNLIKLEKDKRSILQDKKIERLKYLFSETPVNNKNNFIAAKIDFVATSYKPQKPLAKIILFSTIFGLLISFIYIFIYSAITARK